MVKTHIIHRGKALILGALLGLATPLFAQPAKTATPPTRILFLLDGSGSMLAQLGNTDRITVAKNYLGRLADSLNKLPNVQIALRVFGHTRAITVKDCNDTRLEVPFGPQNQEEFKDKLFNITARGFSPIANSILASANDFPASPKGRNIIILITDGLEECTGDPCVISQQLQAKGIILQPFIVGLGVDDEKYRFTYSCAGEYYDAKTEDEFVRVMGVIISQALNKTTSQLNLLDVNGLPVVTDVPFTVYDAANGNIVSNQVHTLNGRGLPDTLFLDPLRKYNIVLHTMPQVEKTNVEIKSGRHNIIPIDCGQGDLELKITGITKYPRLQSIIRRHGQTETVNAQEFNTKKRYLVGSYDLEILTTPRIVLNDIKVRQNNTTLIDIPQPGVLHTFYKRQYDAAIFMIENNKMKWVADINTTKPSEEIVMQPGKYKIVGRAKGETRTVYSFEREFTITSGTATDITL